MTCRKPAKKINGLRPQKDAEDLKRKILRRRQVGRLAAHQHGQAISRTAVSGLEYRLPSGGARLRRAAATAFGSVKVPRQRR
jgi:hypothetical protein